MRPHLWSIEINYVDYARYYYDGRVVSLYTDKEYVNSFVKYLIMNSAPTKQITAGMHLWTEYINPDYLLVACNQFQHSHGITILTEFNEYSEIFNIATHPENTKMLGFYLNQQPILFQILNYIRDKSKKLINKLEDSPFILPRSKIVTIPPEKLDEELLKILSSTSTFTIYINNIGILLSKREAQCLHYLHQGKTAKEIAKVLSISPRTIEIHFDNIRTKTSSKSRIELITKISKAQLENLAIAI